MRELGKSSKKPSQITLSVLLTRNSHASRLVLSSCKYETSGKASWKIDVSSESCKCNNARVTLYCRRKLSSDTFQTVYSVRLISDTNIARKFLQDIYKQGHATFSGPTRKTSATFDLFINSNVWKNIHKYGDTSLQMHITILEPPAEDMNVKMYEDAFNFVDKAQLFSESSAFQPDCVILFENKKEVHVNKNLLSLHSDWWKDTFANYNDRVPLINVDYEQFLDFLCVIYPTAHPITAKNVETLLGFAHDFKMTELLRRCDIFLTAYSDKFGKRKLLLLAQNYNLQLLQAQCISEYKNLEDIKAHKMKSEYANLNDRSKRMLLDKILGINPSALSEAPRSEYSALSSVVTNEMRASQILDKLASLSSCHSDIVLVVGNAQIHAHKHLLSYFSEFFNNMFKSGLKESRENEITLEEVRYEEMVELLSITYPSDFCINETNIATIVKLADRFVMPIILDRCKQELKNSNKIKGALKLWLARRTIQSRICR